MSSNDKFRAEFLFKLSMKNISITRNSLEIFLQICIGVPDKHVPQREKYNRGNNMSFMNNALARTHMKRSRSRNV